jgi:spermidine/putrescine transport system substrate-binding protein
MTLVRTRPMAAAMAAILVLAGCSGAKPTTGPATQGPATPQAATPIPATPVPATPVPATPVPATPVPATPVPATATPLPPSAPPVTAPPAATPDPSVTGSLTVLDWAGYDAQDFWTDFATLYPKATVNFEIGASDQDIYTKMAAGDQADIFHPYTGWLQFYVDQNLVEEIDTTKLSNWSKVPDNLKKLGQINGKQYFLPWDVGFTSVLYNTDKVTTPIDSWAALLDPKYKGHISMWDDGPGAVTVSSYVHGYDETKITDAQLADIKAEWIAQKDSNIFYWAGEPDLVNGFKTGDVWVAYAWQSAFATLLADQPVAYATPKEGRNSWVGLYGIRKGTANLDLAHKFLDAKLGIATGSNVVNLFYFGHSNADVMAAVSDPALIKAFGLDDPSILEKTNFTPNLTDAQRVAWGEMWTEVKAAP